MKIYISKNNQQLGPFDEEKVLEMLKTGQLSANDLAIRQGESEWQKLANLYPPTAAETAIPAVAAPAISDAPPAKKSRKGLLLGCGGIFLVGLLVSAALGLFAYRNIRPADSIENLPDSVKTDDQGEFKLTTRIPPKGNIWGTETNYVGIYENKTSKKSVIYMLTVYKDAPTAREAMQTELLKTCQAGEKQMQFSFLDKDKHALSEAATCAAPLYILKDDKLVILGGSGASVSEWTAFAENLFFNKGSKMTMKN